MLNAVDPRFVMPIFEGALAAGADYLDMAMSLSHPHPDDPYEQTGVKLGDEQFAAAGRWTAAGRLALVGIGVEPGLSDVFARYAADHLFSRIDEIGIRDGGNLVVDGLRLRALVLGVDHHRGVPQPAGDLRAGPRLVHHRAARASRRSFDFPGGIGPVECVHVEHEEVLLIPRWVDAGKVTFKYGLGKEFIDVLQDAAQARPGPHPAGPGRRRLGVAARRGRRGACPTRPRWATR